MKWELRISYVAGFGPGEYEGRSLIGRFSRKDDADIVCKLLNAHTFPMVRLEVTKRRKKSKREPAAAD